MIQFCIDYCVNAWDNLAFRTIFLAVVFDGIRILVFDAIAIWVHLKKGKQGPYEPPEHQPLVSVIMPGFNVEDFFEKSVGDVLNSDYRNLEVIFVSDGSDDGTPEVMRRMARADPRLRCIQAQRGGKSAALNLALCLSRSNYVLQIDLRTRLDPQAISRMMNRLVSSPESVVVSGRIDIANAERSTTLQLQSLEMLIRFGAGTIAADAMGTIKIVSGCFALWRKEALLEVGGWDQPMGEDGCMTCKIRKRGGHMAYAPDAVCHAMGRDGMIALTKQRYRWNRSFIKCRFRKHPDIALPYMFGWLNFATFVESMTYRVVLWVAVIIATVNLAVFHTNVLVPHLLFVAFLYSFISVVQFPLDVMLVSDNPKKDMRMFPYLLLLHPYRIYMRFLQVVAFFMEVFFYDSYTAASHLPPSVAKATEKW